LGAGAPQAWIDLVVDSRPLLVQRASSAAIGDRRSSVDASWRRSGFVDVFST
jgi:hypothetical protein